jgi:16S rRNA (guanine527-N7)-methyltransferase
LAERLLSLCGQMGCQLAEAQARGILRYTAAVLEANASINLTRISDIQSALRLHAVDSLTATVELARAPAGPLLDLGSGGGFPGVPLAIQSSRPTVLLDSVTKKLVAVQRILDLMSLGDRVQTVSGRAERHVADAAHSYSAVVARAVAPLPSLVELAAPLLAQDGLLIAMKGDPSRDEIGAGRVVAGMVGLEEVSMRVLSLPDGGESRTIVCYRRVSSSNTRLPRRTGLAQHRPLA